MQKRIAYIILILLLAIFSFVGFKMGAKSEVFGDASQIIINETMSKTGAINSVTATVFDFRGYDTLGEAIVLFTAICGVAAVLREEKKAKEEKKKKKEERLNINFLYKFSFTYFAYFRALYHNTWTFITRWRISRWSTNCWSCCIDLYWIWI